MKSDPASVVMTNSQPPNDLFAFSIAFADGLLPPPDVTVSEWADRHRILGRNSAEPGPWRTDRVPYVREIQDNMSAHSGVEMTVLVKAAQGAGTEAILNSIGYRMDCTGGNILFVLPTTGVAKKVSRTRVAPMIEDCPRLREKVAPVRSRSASNTVLMKDYAGGTLLFAGANSASGLRSDPVPNLVMDEEDAYPVDLDGEGSPGELAIQRTATFRNRRIFRVSTPTLLQFSAIWKAFLSGDQRYFHVPCPACGKKQALVWSHKGRPGGVVWPKGKPDEARYQCEHCGELFEEWRKNDILPQGEWIPTAPGNGGGRIRSYQINALYYPYGWPENAWPNLAAKWLRQYRDPVALKTFWNLKLGLPWDDPSEAKVDADTLFGRREQYGPEVPLGACVITAFADVQPDRIECGATAWGPGDQNWALEYLVFPGDTSKTTSEDGKSSPWERLDQWNRSEWLSEYGVSLGISIMGVDSGYNTQTVTQWCAERAQRNIFATKGKEGQRPIYSQKAQRQRGKHPPPQIVGIDTAKEHIYAGFKIVQPGPRFSHFPIAPGFERNYFEMLTAEVRIPNYSKPTPTFEWRKKSAGARNEALDVRVGELWGLNYLVQARLFNLEHELKKLEGGARARAEREQRVSVHGAKEEPKQTMRDLFKPIPMRSDD